ncbi:flagellar hook-basal body complex protein FliE [Alloalcanivorax mobilis]|uniref:flagellar hook-basal body complex protein FliE n=1 Tax=Alloalcanivorax mobilis TaxID=2019569 RepID=UPI000B5B117C|nr:flagellar hook-basal body complex protein FliE [Alloalcanivorax mobilis]ASK34792.1 flagellar hook-basal body complex protein FliE [Alcanivorax sp. N3-2A]
MTTAAIESALSQMQSLASQAAGDSQAKGGLVSARVGAGGFADELYSSFQRINELQQHAGAQSKAFQAGEPGIALYDVMIDSQKASVAFQMGVQVRNRLVTAYKDVMNMQV